ncbi:cation diffusion facilitator family transporter [Clostridium algidicarnis]|uniref:Cation diffusion facilitator family transporter n=2 Tax=Clostridium algidicarnis TaxID=37659 RepID=A0A2S6FW43_9CLOT|nr:cation diffusion facilitator family transporter [Clostridium algidicarnis]MBB6631078.1 cation transporter [Clostridium algidicarnis]MBB6696599.1 cation transporter [Clostridium algidicarnis]MBU3203852.1 cation diffusion facilitator family transporter [Clostridium algidicarnis]MBU3207435.1 cation diffusion facilitator family transporter [Clostridium algidicarnis]MBU3209737.1 cation diffusion facilitator family transporter [Clostridium algidicarnis]
MENAKLGTRASLITILVNIVLCIFKMLAAFVGKSSAMLADAVHSLADILTTVMVIIGLKVSSKAADTTHPYGHEKFEPIFAKIMSFILIFTGVSIGYKALMDLISGNLNYPGKIALIAAAVSIFVKELMYWYTIKIAKKIKSVAMETDAWHHRSDALSSIGTFLGILGARMGLKILDPIAGLLVSFLIIKIGIEYYLKSINELVDHSAEDNIVKQIEYIASNVPGVINIVNLKTRSFGNKVYADIEISVDGDLTINEGDKIAENVHGLIEDNISDIKHCLVKLKPK